MRRATGPTSAATRSFISAAALLVNVIARIENGDASRSAIEVREPVREHARLARTRPATTSTGPTGSVTASCCAGFSPVEIEGARRGRGASSRVSRIGVGAALRRVEIEHAGRVVHRTPPSYRGRTGADRTYVRLRGQRRSIGDHPERTRWEYRLKIVEITGKDDTIAATPGARSHFLDVLVAGGVVEPTAPVRLENRARPWEAEVVADTCGRST